MLACPLLNKPIFYFSNPNDDTSGVRERERARKRDEEKLRRQHESEGSGVGRLINSNNVHASHGFNSNAFSLSFHFIPFDSIPFDFLRFGARVCVIFCLSFVITRHRAISFDLCTVGMGMGMHINDGAIGQCASRHQT